MRKIALAVLGAAGVAAAGLIASQVVAQDFKVGQTVEASPLALDSRWEQCTVTGVTPGGDIEVACGPRKTQYIVQAKWVRPAAGGGDDGAAASPPDPAPVAPPVSRPPVAGNAGPCPDAPRGRVGNRQQENGVCRIGASLVDREGRQGVVIDAPASDSCRLCLADGSYRDYLTWSLSTSKQQSAAPARGLPSGSYHCSGGAAGNMNITIQAGRWNGYYAETLPDGRVGISSQPNGRPYYMVCERR